MTLTLWHWHYQLCDPKFYRQWIRSFVHSGSEVLFTVDPKFYPQWIQSFIHNNLGESCTFRLPVRLRDRGPSYACVMGLSAQYRRQPAKPMWGTHFSVREDDRSVFTPTSLGVDWEIIGWVHIMYNCHHVSENSQEMSGRDSKKITILKLIL